MTTIGVISVAIAVPLTIAVTFALGMRLKWPLVLDAVSRFNKVAMNPRQMRKAGTPGADASIVHHAGRTSGEPYDTPIRPVPVDDGFVIGLPYGTRPDWVKNVLAAGSASIVHEGRTHLVDRPEIVATSSVAHAFGPGDQKAHRMFAVDQCLRVRTADQRNHQPRART